MTWYILTLTFQLNQARTYHVANHWNSFGWERRAHKTRMNGWIEVCIVSNAPFVVKRSMKVTLTMDWAKPGFPTKFGNDVWLLSQFMTTLSDSLFAFCFVVRIWCFNSLRINTIAHAHKDKHNVMSIKTFASLFFVMWLILMVLLLPLPLLSSNQNSCDQSQHHHHFVINPIPKRTSATGVMRACAFSVF